MAFVRVAAKHITKAPKQNVKIIKDNKSYTYTGEYIHMSQWEAHTQMNWACGPSGFGGPITFPNLAERRAEYRTMDTVRHCTWSTKEEKCIQGEALKLV